MNKRIHIATFGCQMNDYESDRTFRLFKDVDGYEWAPVADEADVVLFNTCSIREKADHKAMSSLGWLRAVKEKRPDMVIAVGGCMAQTQGEEIQKRFPYVDIVFGTHQWNALPALVKKAQLDRQRSLEIDLYGWRNYQFLPYREAHAAHPVCDVVTIQNGCNKFCSFCLVPFTRGRETSRSINDILREIEVIADQGTREITLLGQNVNAYGTDLRREPHFSDLLLRVAKIEGIERIRFVTSHPSNLTQELIDVMANTEKICEHLHLPLQSGSDRILHKMRRDYDMRKYGQTIEYLRKKIPNIFLSSDFIVGFPSETEEDFEKTLEAMRAFEFADSYSFCFSPRPHTKASEWTDEFVEESVANERLQRLQQLQRELKTRKCGELVGTEVEVLVEGSAKFGGGYHTGKTRQNISVNFAGGAGAEGRRINVLLTDFNANTFRGTMVQ